MSNSTCRCFRPIALPPLPGAGGRADTHPSKANDSSILIIQVFDQKKFKKKDQGFLGVINIRVGDVLELGPQAEGTDPRCPT